MSTPSTEPSFSNGAKHLVEGASSLANGMAEIVKATYNFAAPALVSAANTACHVTVTYVVPAVLSAGETALTFVKGKPSAPTAEPFDLTEQEDDGFTVINNGTELTRRRSASVPF